MSNALLSLAHMATAAGLSMYEYNAQLSRRAAMFAQPTLRIPRRNMKKEWKRLRQRRGGGR